MAKQTDIRFAEGTTAEDKKKVMEVIAGKSKVISFKNLKTGAIQVLTDSRSSRNHIAECEKLGTHKLLYPIVLEEQKKK
jgi:hypothetical protein